MRKNTRRIPKDYDGTEVTTHQVSDVLTAVLARIHEKYQEHPDLVLAAWPGVIGPKLAGMTQAVSFSDGIFVVKVKNSTLHSLLNQNEKPRILRILREKFPKVMIKGIVFRMG
ncbi:MULTISPECIES: DUF721 domain-containing protein [Parachlamydia]|uniref:Uncharacterized protein n=1 Tax=Parachlamydia acanthamoebae (strain UV7) TaxID=765952 RepID=F8KZR8_PARAV|nr:DUF721 domain-containing protein [Parachlamydia acanthamoebae]EFB42442.1 hypothetical protein pah_c008o055 [Parachlamydia acanthamoebae str. Hall's coccus]CCB86424.1 putative uncharacterized protein [Parachlamydia acanthamoebae UV-7]